MITRQSTLASGRGSKRSLLALALNMLLIVSLSCSLPTLDKPTTAPGAPVPAVSDSSPTPMPSPTPLPPALVESDPPPGSEIPLDAPITLYFNQPMDARSVEGSLSGQPILSGKFTWIRENALTFTPDTPFLPGSDLTLSVGANARSKNGLALLNPLTLSYRTVGYLRLTQALPEPGALDVNPTSAIVASFNRPVVALGSQDEEAPFTIEPASDGYGEWINTSTYVFYPQPALAGGVSYEVAINPELNGVDGSPLAPEEEEGLASSWSFTTSLPELLSIDASGETGASNSGVRLDAEVLLSFNQPMQVNSVEESFRLLDADSQPVPGQITPNEDLTEYTFRPESLLDHRAAYTAVLETGALDLGGAPIERQVSTVITTVPALGVEGSEPAEGGILPTYSSIILRFSANLPPDGLERFFTFNPGVPNFYAYLDYDQKTLYLYGDFAPDTAYSLSISPDLPDAWNGNLGQPFNLNFRTAPLEPAFSIGYGMDVLFLTPQDASLPGQATNLTGLSYTLGSVPLDDFIAMTGMSGYDIRQTYQPRAARTMQQAFALEPNVSQPANLELSADGRPLDPGLYYLRMNAGGSYYFPGPLLLVVSNLQITFKISATDALVWAIDLRDNSPAANAPISIYDELGSLLASGQTDSQGIFKTEGLAPHDPYAIQYAVLGNPGESDFGFALSSWNMGLSEWMGEAPVDLRPPRVMTYLYTDRPIYKPGQTVYFRGVSRLAYNGRYTVPDAGSVLIYLQNDFAETITTFDLPLSAYGTFHGEVNLPPDLAPGSYRLGTGNGYEDSISFMVADYRKPEINLQVAFTEEEALAGQTLTAQVEALYFFGAPASNLPLRWSLYSAPSTFRIPGYEVGPLDVGWMDAYNFSFFPMMGELIAEGEAVTRPDGTLVLGLPSTPLLPSSLTGEDVGGSQRQYTLEVTVRDESEMPVSSRAGLTVHPSSIYIGVKPDAWTARAGEEIGFEVLTTDWENNPAGERSLAATFQKVVWVQEESSDEDRFPYPKFTPVYTPAGSASFSTGSNGVARLAFKPEEPGTYQFEVSGMGARTQTLIWVGGPGQAVWPSIPNQRLKLTPDRERYLPGETAQVFIPNPLGASALALVTIERGIIMRSQVVEVEGNGLSLDIPLGEEDAPNVYLTVTLLGRDDAGRPDFRQGIANLHVEPLRQSLNLEVTRAPEAQSGPGDSVTFSLSVTNSDGQPVQGEFSLALVDLAVLALADPNSKDILPAFYGVQPLGVRSALSLAAHVQRTIVTPPGMGGGGGDIAAPTVVREDFPDTAYWNAEIVTDADGRAQVEVELPDSLTTWQLDVRGLTPDTRVGQAQDRVITTKDLLVRPVTPRFLVVGDHVRMAAVVHNNTDRDLEAEVSIQAVGFTLDDEAPPVQVAETPAGGRVRIEWWGTVQDVDEVNLLFSAAGGGLQDAARPAAGGTRLPTGQRLSSGALPVLRYISNQAFAASGYLEEGGERLELVSLPLSFEAGQQGRAGGNLTIELSPSLAAAMLDALAVLERFPYEGNEQTISRFLPNLETLRALETFGVDVPDLRVRLDRTLNDSITRLLSRQNADGGWGWWSAQQVVDRYASPGSSDPYISAYILFGLSRAKEMGIHVEAEALRHAVDYLYASLPAPQMVTESWQLDRLVFVHFALAQAGEGDPSGADALYELRSQLNPWSQALLALTIDTLSAESDAIAEPVKTLFSDLQAGALRSSTGVHWQNSTPSRQNPGTPVFNTAVVVYALARRDPASPLLVDAVRYLMANRNSEGGWASTYETAWTLMGVAEYMKGIGEWGADFSFSAALNGVQLARGQAEDGDTGISPVSAQVPLSNLYPNDPNALVIKRDAGTGRLYYTARLNVSQPVESIAPLNQGLTVSRDYYSAQGIRAQREPGDPIRTASVGETVSARLTLIVPNDAYHVMVEDFIPAGSEILDLQLKTSAFGESLDTPLYDPSDPYSNGWGWWNFHQPQIYSDRIAWSADYLPAGTYELFYTLTLLSPGEFRVLPAHAWELYFPEVQGSSAGTMFVIQEN